MSGGMSSVKLRDVGDFTVGVSGLAVTALVAANIINPVGWVFEAALFTYGTVTLIYDAVNEP